MACRQPESGRRPNFHQLVELLSQADFELFAWEEEDLSGSCYDPRAKVIGAPLNVSKNLFTELQRLYITED